MTTDPPFAGPRLKIKRAEQHTHEISVSIRQYVDRRPCRVVCHDGSEQGKPQRHLWQMHLDEEPPDLRTILGDLVHNLRAALDLLASDLVTLNNGDASKVYFPMAEAADQLDRRIRDTRFDRASDEAIALLKSIGPYPEGLHSLRSLHDMDIMDKHRRLVPIVTGAILPNFSISGNFFHGSQLPIRDGQAVFDIPANPGNTIGQQFFVQPEFKFPKEGPFSRHPLTPILETLCADIHQIVERFAVLYQL